MRQKGTKTILRESISSSNYFTFFLRQKWLILKMKINFTVLTVPAVGQASYEESGSGACQSECGSNQECIGDECECKLGWEGKSCEIRK